MDGDLVKLAKPYGVRSCRDGGVWDQCRDYVGVASEREAVRRISRSECDFRLLLRELKGAMERATLGRLTYGDRDDVSKTRRSDFILELRMSQRVQYPDGVRAVRLYFCEPDVVPGQMLIAKLGAKPATEAGLSVQDEQIDEADLRVRSHFGII